MRNRQMNHSALGLFLVWCLVGSACQLLQRPDGHEGSNASGSAANDVDPEDPFPEIPRTGSDGAFETLLEDGVKILGSYSAGRRDGLWLRLSVSGQVLVQGSYLKGAQDGEWTVFYDGSGQMKESGSYQRGLAVGTWEMYYPNGSCSRPLSLTRASKTGTEDHRTGRGGRHDLEKWSAGRSRVNYDRAGRVVAGVSTRSIGRREPGLASTPMEPSEPFGTTEADTPREAVALGEPR